jgi:hypothetical protein
MYHALFNAPSYVLTHQVILKDKTVSVSVLHPHAKPILQPKHKELRSVGDNVGANTSIALDSASSIHLFKDRSRFLIELVSRVTMLMNSIPKKGGIHRIISPRELITGKKLRVLEHHIGQYVQGHTGGNNDTGKERSVDALYIGRANNGSRHVVFKLSTKQCVSVNRVTAITPTADHIKLVEDIAEAENQPEGLKFSNINGKVTLDDFIDGINDDGDDSNASDDENTKKSSMTRPDLRRTKGWR